MTQAPGAAAPAIRELAEEECERRSAEPMVSVVIATYNDRERLQDCLGSIADQSYPSDKYEIIAVDDGSTDGTIEAVRRAFPAVRLIVKSHTGADDSRNHGIAAAKGEIIALTDSDCTVPRDWISSIVRAIAGNAGAVVGGRILHSGSLWARLVGVSEFGGYVGTSPRDVAVIPSCNLGAKRRVFEEILFDPRLVFEGDVLICHYLKRTGRRVVFVPEIVVHHHPSDTAGASLRRARRYGDGFVRTRLLEPTLPYASFVRAGTPGIIFITAARVLLDWWRLVRWRRESGIRRLEVPLAFLVLLAKRMVSLPAAIRAYRLRDV